MMELPALFSCTDTSAFNLLVAISAFHGFCIVIIYAPLVSLDLTVELTKFKINP